METVIELWICNKCTMQTANNATGMFGHQVMS